MGCCHVEQSKAREQRIWVPLMIQTVTAPTTDSLAKNASQTHAYPAIEFAEDVTGVFEDPRNVRLTSDMIACMLLPWVRRVFWRIVSLNFTSYAAESGGA